MKITAITQIGMANGLTREIEQRWYQVWLRAGGADRDIPLAAFIRNPELLVSGPDDPAIEPPFTKRRTRYPRE